MLRELSWAWAAASCCPGRKSGAGPGNALSVSYAAVQGTCCFPAPRQLALHASHPLSVFVTAARLAHMPHLCSATVQQPRPQQRSPCRGGAVAQVVANACGSLLLLGLLLMGGARWPGIQQAALQWHPVCAPACSQCHRLRCDHPPVTACHIAACACHGCTCWLAVDAERTCACRLCAGQDPDQAVDDLGVLGVRPICSAC